MGRWALVLIGAAALAGQANAQFSPVLNTSGLPSRSEMNASIAALQAQIPQPATTAPGAEMVGGAPGTDTRYALANHSHPRISRTGSCVLSASGTCTITWTTAFPAGVSPVMLGDPVAVNTGAAQPIDCDVTSTPTITGVSVKCWQSQNSILSLSIVTSGITVAPFGSTTLSGVTVTASAIPASQ